MGKPFMPWQQYVADVIMEIDPATGRLAYDEFGLTVPRQSGKSTFILAKFVHRCSATGYFGGRQRVVYTAQTRQKAREKWEEDYVADLDDARAFRGRYTVNKAAGNEHIRFKNGSRFGIEANTEKAGHGGTLDEAYIDEAFSQVDFRLEQAFGPAMITRPKKQLGWISTAGWSDAAPYLKEKVRLGRRSVEADRGFGLAYFDWSAPEGADPGDEDVWQACMPALGHTIDIDAIRSVYQRAVDADKLADFMRAYLNLWVPKPTEAADIEPPALPGWLECTDDRSEVATHAAFGVAVALDRSVSAIGAAGLRADGAAHLEIVDRGHRRGVEWVIDRCVELDAAHAGANFVIDGGGPAARLIDPLQNAGLTVIVLNTRDVGSACAWLVDAVAERSVFHGPQPALDVAVAGAKRRNIGDGMFAFGRRVSSADISPLEAVTLAGHVLPSTVPLDSVTAAFM